LPCCSASSLKSAKRKGQKIMGKIVVACIGIMALLLADVCAGTKQENLTLSVPSGPTIVIIGGANSTTEQLELLRGNFPGAVVIVPDKFYPLWFGADTVLRQIKDKDVKGKLVLIGHSWGAFWPVRSTANTRILLRLL
jgi:hypothetical protein